jgi:hypothetical protein
MDQRLKATESQRRVFHYTYNHLFIIEYWKKALRYSHMIFRFVLLFFPDFVQLNYIFKDVCSNLIYYIDEIQIVCSFLRVRQA